MNAKRRTGWCSTVGWPWAVGLTAVGLMLGAWGLLDRLSALAGEGGGDPTPHVEITTGGTLEIVQDPDDCEIKITAEIKPTDHTIGWRITGDGADYVSEAHTQTGNASVVTISLKSPVSNNFGDDTSITVKAYDTSDEEICDSVSVNVLKFKRNDKCSPGSQKVTISLPFGNNEIGWTGEVLLEAYITGDILQTMELKTPAMIVPDANTTENFKYYYESETDRGSGSYSLRDSIPFSGSGEVSGTYGGWGHGATVRLATGVTAGVDNEEVHINDNMTGTGYNGTPMSITLGINVAGGTAGGEGGGGISVDITLSEQNFLNDTASSSGSHIVEEGADHEPGHQISIEKRVSVAAAGYLLQEIDDEWFLYMNASLNIELDIHEAVELEFEPDF